MDSIPGMHLTLGHVTPAALPRQPEAQKGCDQLPETDNMENTGTHSASCVFFLQDSHWLDPHFTAGASRRSILHL